MLVAVERQGFVRLPHLATFAGLHPTMLCRVIAKLEEAGLIRRLPAERVDRRVCRVDATAKGHRPSERNRAERNDTLSKKLEGLDSAQLRSLAIALPVLEELAEQLLQPEQVVTSGGRR